MKARYEFSVSFIVDYRGLSVVLRLGEAAA